MYGQNIMIVSIRKESDLLLAILAEMTVYH